MVGKYKAYPEYKNTNDKFINVIPKHWNIYAVKHIGRLNGGSGFPIDEQGKEYEELPFFKVNALSQADAKNNLQAKNDTISYTTAKKLNAYIFKPNSIVFAKVGAALLLGRIRKIKYKACLDNNMMGVEIFCSDYDNDFIFYSMNLVRFDYIVNSGTIPSVNEFQIGNVYLSIPPIAEQKQIANFLDYETAKIDTLIKKQHQLIKLLEEKRKTVISHAVTKGLNPNVSMKDSGVEWLGEIPEHWLSVGFKKYLNPIVDYRGKTPEKVEDGIFLVTARNIKEGKINYSLSHEFIKEVDYKDIMRRGIPKIGDVIFTTEAPLGEVANIDNENIALAQRIIKFRGKDQIVDNYYLKYFIMSDQFQQGLNTYATGSTAQGIKAERLGYLFLLIPPYKEQSNIVNYLDLEILKLNQLMVKANQVIELLKERRTALISAAVTGKIDVRDWQAPTITV